MKKKLLQNVALWVEYTVTQNFIKMHKLERYYNLQHRLKIRASSREEICHFAIQKVSIKFIWEQAAQNRTKWRCLIKKGAAQYEAERFCGAEKAQRTQRKSQWINIRVVTVRV